MILRTSSSHEEGVVRDFSINTKAFLADDQGRVRALRGIRLEWAQDNGRPVMKEIPGSEFELPCELVLLALGFLGPETDTVISQLGCELTVAARRGGGRRHRHRQLAARHRPRPLDGDLGAPHDRLRDPRPHAQRVGRVRQCGVLGAIGALSGIAIGAMLSAQIVTVALRLVTGWRIPFTLSLGPLLAGVAAAALVSAFAGWVPARAAARVTAWPQSAY